MHLTYDSEEKLTNEADSSMNVDLNVEFESKTKSFAFLQLCAMIAIRFKMMMQESYILLFEVIYPSFLILLSGYVVHIMNANSH